MTSYFLRVAKHIDIQFSFFFHNEFFCLAYSFHINNLILIERNSLLKHDINK
jgi:hypothetical protein